jgi:hypothetical protein
MEFARMDAEELAAALEKLEDRPDPDNIPFIKISKDFGQAAEDTADLTKEIEALGSVSEQWAQAWGQIARYDPTWGQSLEGFADDNEDTADRVVSMWQHAAENIHDSFSNLLSTACVEEIESLEAIYDAIRM